ncbi:flagellar basal-body rod protein FlgB [Leptospira santarosai str. CBC1416]|uniref:Flagellar basal body rod protein FlgB n=5 Tax=Leptospira santarosai TaxID=28183 RepID=M6UL80_9LEPT|nr:Flagellar basal body rod protein FlgB [Leptospira santarosai]EKO32783.1 flagellar basal-body rod protein FlgB [Leptospira santarosai str. MOR084]EKO77014.1 flagellar basal-body rod protein FlgB [Leptospira sp. Fiocruz LV3954]EKR93681.1 flagellar basal-body rod protein FlgB [Leptospira santarosai str. CBC379]EKS08528.1 flagellar basal-body rod protein FlgB [Leptospira santarosai str. JET]EKT87245.2 flagellar basal body rod protein FlgB [Leptospira santarosai serovar Shermani str. LT 821]EMF
MGIANSTDFLEGEKIMFEKTHFMKTQDLLERGMNNSVFKRKIISDNIANADVPHFKRSEVIFESMIKRAIESEKIEALKEVPTQISDERHISFFKPLDYREVQPKANIDYLTTMRADGNNVDVEKEVVEASNSQMQYMMMTERLNQNYRDLKQVMRMA